MTATALSEVRDLLGGEKFPGCESPSLRLEKFVRIGGDNAKHGEIDAVVDCQRKNGKEPEPPPLPPGGKRFPARLKSRLIVNQAGGILENAGMCLHPHFGYPYIPGSAVKGIARHAAWGEWHEAKEPEKECIAQDIARVFGYPTNDKGLDAYLEERGCDAKRGGCISFWAAEPDGKAGLVTDIVNCHRREELRVGCLVIRCDSRRIVVTPVVLPGGGEGRHVCLHAGSRAGCGRDGTCPCQEMAHSGHYGKRRGREDIGRVWLVRV